MEPRRYTDQRMEARWGNWMDPGECLSDERCVHTTDNAKSIIESEPGVV